MDDGDFDQVTELPWEAIDERLQRYRLQRPGAEQAMARSLERYGQISPIVVCRQEEKSERKQKRTGTPIHLARRTSESRWFGENARGDEEGWVSPFDRVATKDGCPRLIRV